MTIPISIFIRHHPWCSDVFTRLQNATEASDVAEPPVEGQVAVMVVEEGLWEREWGVEGEVVVVDVEEGLRGRGGGGSGLPGPVIGYISVSPNRKRDNTDHLGQYHMHYHFPFFF